MAGSASCGASRSWSTPKPAAPPSTSARRALPTVARIRAPHSAPQPKTEAISPNVRAPSSSVSFATRGSSTSKLNENVPTRRTVKKVTATRRELTAKRSASTTEAKMPGAARCAADGGQPDREQAADHDRVAQRVEAERDARPEGRDDDAAECGPDDARRRPEARAEPDRVRDVLGTDDLEDERVPRGRVECDGDAVHEPEHVELPGGDEAGQREHAEQGRLREQHALAADHHPPQVDPVRDRAADERDERDRQRQHERERADRDGRVGEVEDQPVRRDQLHPRADERDAVADVVEAVVAVPPQAAEGGVADPR